MGLYENQKIFFDCLIIMNMDALEEKKIVEDIQENRRLPYSIELLEVDENKYIIRNNFGSTVEYFKKDGKYYLEEELD